MTGNFTSDGAISIAFELVSGAKSYLTHYAGANEPDPKNAIYMGYTETNSWTLPAKDVPSLNDGDKIYIYVQAYNETGVGADDVEKARYLHDGDFVGSEWSDPVILTKEQTEEQ